MSGHNIEHDERVVAFVDIAHQYCTLIESRATFSRPDFIKECAAILAQLFADAVRLLDVTVEDFDGSDLEGMSHDERCVIFENLQQMLGDDDRYWLVFDPYKKEEPIISFLSDDLSDTYRDVKTGLDLFGRTKGDSQKAVWAWQFNFLQHWSHHCANALRAIRCILVRMDEEN
ncbi:MAG: DUF5063 domain-containing protein [Phycisphaerae bacterium]